MAAAVTLSEAGVPVTVYESAAVLGGRARAVDHQGVRLDNGQHLLIGAYRETLRLVRRLHAEPSAALLELPLDLHLPGRFRLRAANLPAPLHAALGLLTAEGIPLSDRLAAALFMIRMRVAGYRLANDITVSALLAAQQQSAALRSLLWEPLCISALNTPPASASAQVFLNVLRDALDGTRGDSNLVASRVSLTELFPAPAAAFVTRNGGSVLTGNTVNRISLSHGAFTIAHARGESMHTHVVCAVSPHRASALLGALPELHPIAATIDAMTYQPIYTVFLQFEEPVALPGPMVGMEGCLTQWIFDRERLCGQSGLVAVVISAEGAHRSETQSDVAARVMRELSELSGPLPPLRWHRVIAEKRATYSCTPGLKRPTNATPVPRFLLAGDYTGSPYPATLETAVRSGIAAASLVTSG